MKRFTIILLGLLLVGCTSGQSVKNTNIIKDDVKLFESKIQLENDNEKVIVSQIKYRSDDLFISGYEITPRDLDDKKYPLIIFNRGGNNGFGKISPEMAIRYLSKYTEEGFVVLASQYRGSHEQGKDEMGGEDINDIYNLIDIAHDLDYIDTDRIYMLGVSRGGIMTYISLKDRNDIKAAAVIGGVSDVIDGFNSREQKMKNILIKAIGGTPEEMKEEYIKRSAIYWSEKITEPLLILHGEFDKRVGVSQPIFLSEALSKNGTENKLIIYKKDDHGLSNNHKYAFYEIIEWFNTH